MTLDVRAAVPLAPLTTLELGGPAAFYVEAADEAQVAEALAWARARDVPVLVLGGGSNVVIADAGFDGLVVRMVGRGRTVTGAGPTAYVDVAAGEPWDELVAWSVGAGLQGLESLSGIPGSTGATPVQNVGAYGQEVAACIAAVRVVARRTGEAATLEPGACRFGYRDSAFKRDPERYVVVGVTFTLARRDTGPVAYEELDRALGASGAPPTLANIRAAVLALRRRKSMVLDADDPNRRSVGSFFTNPIVDAADAARVCAVAVTAGLAPSADAVPRWPMPGGRVKLAAGWLIERAGVARGMRRGAVGVSSAHALALVHHGGGTAAALVALAREVRDAVAARFGVTLQPEPALVGLAL